MARPVLGGEGGVAAWWGRERKKDCCLPVSEKEQPKGKGWGRWRSASEVEWEETVEPAERGRGLVRGTALFGLREKSSGWREEGKNLMKGGRPLRVREKKTLSFLGFSFLCCLLPNVQNYPPIFLSCGPIFIGKMLFGLQN